MCGRALCLLALVAISLARSVVSVKDTFPWRRVPLYANRVGPFSNPSETYQYYDLPFCQPPGGLRYERQSLGEVVDGNRLVTTPYNLSFRTDIQRAVLCRQHFTPKQLDILRKAVRENYYFEMFYDDHPTWGSIGFQSPEKAGSQDLRFFIYTHLHFDVHFNHNHDQKVIMIKVKTNPEVAVDISKDVEQAAKEGLSAEFTYSVQWHAVLYSLDMRVHKYRKLRLMARQLRERKLSLLYPCGTLLVTVSMACTLISYVKSGFMISRDDNELDRQEETGWRCIRGDVFRPPPHKSLLCAFVGSGFQLLALALFIFMLALADVFYPFKRGSLFTALIMLYALTAGIAGYTAASCYRRREGGDWLNNLLVTCLIYLGPFCLVFSFNNTVAWVYGSTAALPWTTIVNILVIWALIAIPLCVLGYIAAFNTRADLSAPCRTSRYPRHIPGLPWYQKLMPQMAIAGFLPFCAIYNELYYALPSWWGWKRYIDLDWEVYTIPSVLLIVFIILIIMTAFISVALTYLQLAMEDHQWWWRSFMCGGSTGLFVYAYSSYYYFARSNMSGLIQCSSSFGYMLMVCYALFLVLGTVGWGASLLLVHSIYRAAP